MDDRIKKTIINLQHNNMAGFYVENPQELLSTLSTMLRDGEKIGCGDSVTLEETGVYDYLRNNHFTFYDKHQPGLTSDDKRGDLFKKFQLRHIYYRHQRPYCGWQIV